MMRSLNNIKVVLLVWPRGVAELGCADGPHTLPHIIQTVPVEDLQHEYMGYGGIWVTSRISEGHLVLIS